MMVTSKVFSTRMLLDAICSSLEKTFRAGSSLFNALMIGKIKGNCKIRLKQKMAILVSFVHLVCICPSVITHKFKNYLVTLYNKVVQLVTNALANIN